MLKKCGANPQDIDGFTDFVRTIKGVEIAIMIYENESNNCRVNFRSKGNYIINNIAKSLGGGGHKFAAGAVTSGSPDLVLQKVLDLTLNELAKQAQVKN